MKEPWGLTEGQKKLLNTFKETKGNHLFYFTGGTALSAFYLRHRLSKDLDFFTPEQNIVLPFTKDLLINLSRGALTGRLNRRADLRDFVDVYFLTEVDKLFTFDDLVENARKKDKGCDYYWLASKPERN